MIIEFQKILEFKYRSIGTLQSFREKMTAM